MLCNFLCQNDFLKSTNIITLKIKVRTNFTLNIFYPSSRANLNYDLSLFVVKNLCYIFMLIHSLYPGLVYVVTNLNCNRRRSLSFIVDENGSSSQPSSSQRLNSNDNSIELNLMKSPTPSQPRNLNRVSLHQISESGNESTP